MNKASPELSVQSSGSQLREVCILGPGSWQGEQLSKLISVICGRLNAESRVLLQHGRWWWCPGHCEYGV